MSVEKNDSRAVTRTKVRSVTVTWPSESQMKRKGQLPYVEFGDLKNGNWRLHFTLPNEFKNSRPHTLILRSRGTNYELWLEKQQVTITNKAYISVRKSQTH